MKKGTITHQTLQSCTDPVIHPPTQPPTQSSIHPSAPPARAHLFDEVRVQRQRWMRGQDLGQQGAVELPELGGRRRQVSLPAVFGHKPHHRLILGLAELLPAAAGGWAGGWTGVYATTCAKAGVSAAVGKAIRELGEEHVLGGVGVGVGWSCDHGQLVPGGEAEKDLPRAVRLRVERGRLEAVLTEARHAAQTDAVLQETAEKGREGVSELEGD